MRAAEPAAIPGVLALLAVETFYRPPHRRAGEYLLWALFSLAAPGRVGRLSVGPAQVQLRHWRRQGLLAGLRWTPGRLAVVRDWRLNARACHAFLAAHDALAESDPVRLTRLYTGGDRPGFAPRLAVALRAFGPRSGPPHAPAADPLREPPGQEGEGAAARPANDEIGQS